MLKWILAGFVSGEYLLVIVYCNKVNTISAFKNSNCCFTLLFHHCMIIWFISCILWFAFIMWSHQDRPAALQFKTAAVMCLTPHECSLCKTCFVLQSLIVCSSDCTEMSADPWGPRTVNSEQQITLHSSSQICSSFSTQCIWRKLVVHLLCEWFLKDRVTLKTGVMMLKIQIWSQQSITFKNK